MSHSPKFWKRLNAIIDQNNAYSADKGKRAGEYTRQRRRETLAQAFEELHAIGYKLQDPSNLKPKHVAALGRYWESKGLRPSTIQNRLSVLRVFSGWIGKPGMIRSPEDYVASPESVRRVYKAQHDKSWDGNGIDWWEKAKEAEQYDKRLPIYLALMNLFGLRRWEVLAFRPRIADRGTFLWIEDGTKGGRARAVEIKTEEQRQWLDRAKTLAKSPNAHIGWPDLDKKQAINRFSYYMRRLGLTKASLGVTAHGGRHSYANNQLAAEGVISPVRGGDLKAQRKEAGEIIDEARLKVSQQLGHARKTIITAYSG